jgi:hypothetical protein
MGKKLKLRNINWGFQCHYWAILKMAVYRFKPTPMSWALRHHLNVVRKNEFSDKGNKTFVNSIINFWICRKGIQKGQFACKILVICQTMLFQIHMHYILS